jgi:glycerophosphoryl diester phosphodiesterase
MTSDEVVVLSHDADAQRTALVAAHIRSCTLQQVKGWDLRAGAPGPPARARVAVPTLDEVLEALPAALFNIDVKQSVPDMSQVLSATVERHRASERVLLTSFDAGVLARIRARYRGPTGLSLRDAAAAFFAPGALLRRFPLPGTRLQVPVSYGPLRLDSARFLRKMHGLGLAVDFWVVNDVHQAEALLLRGADGIVSDEPRAMAALFARSPRTAGWRARHPALGSGA